MKGYELMMKREIGNLDAANDKLVELQARIQRADEELGEAKRAYIESKRESLSSHEECFKFEVSQRERCLLRKNTIQSKKVEQFRAREDWHSMEVARNKYEDKQIKHAKALQSEVVKMGVGAVLNRVAIEGYDKRMGSKEEFDKFERLRLVTKGGFPAEVVKAYLTEYDKRRRAKQAADEAEERFRRVEERKKEDDDALRERMSGTSSAKNKEFNAKQDNLTDRLDDAEKKIRYRQVKTSEMARKLAVSAQGLNGMIRKLASVTAGKDENAVGEPDMGVGTAEEVEAMLAQFDDTLTRNSVLAVAVEQASIVEGEQSHMTLMGRRAGGGGIHTEFSRMSIYTEGSQFNVVKLLSSAEEVPDASSSESDEESFGTE